MPSQPNSMQMQLGAPFSDDVSNMMVETLLSVLRKRRVRGVIVGRGSPYQPNSSLNTRRKGVQNARVPHQPRLLETLLHDLRAHPELQELDIVGFLENVASSPPEVLSQYST